VAHALQAAHFHPDSMQRLCLPQRMPPSHGVQRAAERIGHGGAALESRGSPFGREGRGPRPGASSRPVLAPNAVATAESPW